MRKIVLIAGSVIFSLTKAQVGINTEKPQGIFHIDGGKDNGTTTIPSPDKQINDFVVTATGQTAIGTTSPSASAILDISNLNPGSVKRGFLGPKVALTSITDQTTIASPTEGLLVYNLGTGGLGYAGYIFWNGTEWRSLNNIPLVGGTIESITCNRASLTPNAYTAGIPYAGTLSIPYTGGNGGTYQSQIIGPVNGLTATLSAGNFNSGTGVLSYTIGGTPTVTSPVTTTFPLNIGGKTCNVVIGDSDIAPGEVTFYKASIPASPYNVWLSTFVSDLPVLGGKLRLDAYFNADSSFGPGWVSMFPRLVNVTSSPIKLWFSALTNIDRYNAGNYLLAPNPSAGSSTPVLPSSYIDLDNGIYYNQGYNDIAGISIPRVTGYGGGGHQEMLTTELSFDDKWYRVYYFPVLDNKNTSTTVDDTRIIYLSVQRLY